MSFFGYNTDLPRDRPGHSSSQGPMFQQHDAFADLSKGRGGDEAALDFEDTYDGLGLRLGRVGGTPSTTTPLAVVMKLLPVEVLEEISTLLARRLE